MRNDIADITRRMQELRAALIALKESYADNPQQAEAAEDVELALGWALQKIERLSTREDVATSQ
jgi:hypothetical protein